TSNWYHIVMQRESGILKFYVNGNLLGFSNSTIPYVPTSLRIGSQHGVRFYNGKVDDVQIYSKALSIAEIQALYLAPAAPCITCPVTALPAIVGNASACQGTKEVYNIGSITGVTYTWSVTGGNLLQVSGSTFTSTANWSTNGVYTISAIPSNTCVGISRLTVTVSCCNMKVNPSFSISTNSCTGQTFTVINLSTNTSSSSSYKWYFSPDGVPSTSTLANPNPIYYQSPGLKSIKLKISGLGCNQTDSLIFDSLYFFPVPTVELGPDIYICSTTGLAIGPGSISDYRYVWRPGGYVSDSTQTPTVINKERFGKYILEVRSGESFCMGRDTLEIFRTPTITATGSITCGSSGISLIATGTNTGLYPQYTWFSSATSTSPIGYGSPLILNYGDISNVPTVFWVEVSNTTTSINSGSNTIIGSDFNGSLNMTSVGPVPFTVFADNLLLKSFLLKGSTTGGFGNFDVLIKNSSNNIVFKKTLLMSHSLLGSNFEVVVNTDLQSGDYSITITSSGIVWIGGNFSTLAIPGQVKLTNSGSGDFAIAKFSYDYSNFTFIPTCAVRTPVTRGCSMPLSIEFLDFNGEWRDGKVYLLWSEYPDYNIDYFEVQRSFDGVNFTTIRIVKSKVNGTELMEYEIMDSEPISNNCYYRLVQHNFNGTNRYSNIISISPENLTCELQINPNPSSEAFNVRFANTSEGQLIVVDMLGKVILSQSINQESNGFSFGEEYSPGAYLVKFVGKNCSTIKLIIKE
ncbi:MAG: T9SS type A sorting domain-containing protein, partial [Cytophagales bacterium]|nr:T9SS type A sorting domain-containing protein [Cytophagales bacterium]